MPCSARNSSSCGARPPSERLAPNFGKPPPGRLSCSMALKVVGPGCFTAWQGTTASRRKAEHGLRSFRALQRRWTCSTGCRRQARGTVKVSGHGPTGAGRRRRRRLVNDAPAWSPTPQWSQPLLRRRVKRLPARSARLRAGVARTWPAARHAGDADGTLHAAFARPRWIGAYGLRLPWPRPS